MMSNPSSAYAAFAQLLGQTSSISPAEVHGFLLGRGCGGAGFAPDSWLGDLTELLGQTPEGPLYQALNGLQRMAEEELTGSGVSLVLLLPDDDMPLGERAHALGQWCQGFLDGFGIVVGDTALSRDAMETLQDLASIAQISSQLEESDDSEADYMEVMEYLRVAPLLLFSECNQRPAPSKPTPEMAPDTQAPTLH